MKYMESQRDEEGEEGNGGEVGDYPQKVNTVVTHLYVKERVQEGQVR